MKLKLIDDTQIVVDKYEYARLVRNDSEFRELQEHIYRGRKPAYYYVTDEDSGYAIVSMHAFRECIFIRCFNSNDAEYNRVCAEELVELLNAEQ